MRPGAHRECPQFLVDGMADSGIEAHVSTEPPIVKGPYTMPPMTCPHGVRFWLEPTGEQIATWVREKTP